MVAVFFAETSLCFNVSIVIKEISCERNLFHIGTYNIFMRIYPAVLFWIDLSLVITATNILSSFAFLCLKHNEELGIELLGLIYFIVNLSKTPHDLWGRFTRRKSIYTRLVMRRLFNVFQT